MSIQAAVDFLRQEGTRQDESLEQAVERAARAGYAFDASRLRAVANVQGLLERVRGDEALRRELLGAASQRHALCELATRLGADFDVDALSAVLGLLRTAPGALDDAALEQVSGGARFRPEIDDEVLVTFLRGDVRAPIILGSLWNTKDKPPSS